MAAVLELEDLSRLYPGHAALDGLTLSIEEGEFFSLVGPSGSGKTTALRLIAGFEDPTRGAIHLRGAPLGGLPPYHRNVSTVFQNYALFPHLTVKENIEFGLRYRRGEGAPRRVAETIEMLELGGKESRRPAQLSGGERQRVALARSLVLRPEVLLLDEPLSALDPILRKQVRSELKALQRRVGITFLFVTHDQEEALSLSDRMALLNAGRLEQTGAPRELYDRPRTRFAASFLGPVNWVNGIGVRPERLRLAPSAPGGGGPSLRAAVEQTLFLGNCRHVSARTETGAVVVAELASGGPEFAPGEPVHVFWERADELVLPPA
jgi:ABC-type Fe3+/spermidine/putrescine transport system ATPase subunit